MDMYLIIVKSYTKEYYNYQEILNRSIEWQITFNQLEIILLRNNGKRHSNNLN